MSGLTAGQDCMHRYSVKYNKFPWLTDVRHFGSQCRKSDTTQKSSTYGIKFGYKYITETGTLEVSVEKVILQVLMTNTQKSSTYGIKFGYKYITETSPTRNKQPISINCHKDHTEGHDQPE
jgi:hypothetical protein